MVQQRRSSLPFVSTWWTSLVIWIIPMWCLHSTRRWNLWIYHSINRFFIPNLVPSSSTSLFAFAFCIAGTSCVTTVKHAIYPLFELNIPSPSTQTRRYPDHRRTECTSVTVRRERCAGRMDGTPSETRTSLLSCQSWGWRRHWISRAARWDHTWD